MNEKKKWGKFVEAFITSLVDVVWSFGLVIFALGAGLYFTLRTKGIQFRYFRYTMKLIFESKQSEQGISSFQAFCIALSGRVGVGNIAGVATAISLGGPGAVFWMWVMALLGAASAFTESTLSQVYKDPIKNEYRGGTPYFIEKGLKLKWFAVIVAAVVSLSYGILLPGVQANSIAVSFNSAFNWSPVLTGIVMCVLLALIIFGGVRRIAAVADKVVPIMAVGYVIVTAVVLIANFKEIPGMFNLIFSSAFGTNEIFGGITGAAIAWGVRRSLFSNVAGVGEATYSSAAAEVSHPAKQGLVQAFSIYIDTIIVCTATAFMILITDSYSVITESGKVVVDHLHGVEAGAEYTQIAVETVITGFGGPILAVAILFFAFTTLMAYYYISETTLVYLGGVFRNKTALLILKLAFIVMVYIGSTQSAKLIWAFGDLAIGSMAWLNLLAILLLSPVMFKVLKDFDKQKKIGLDPIFDPRVAGVKNADFWIGKSEELLKERDKEKSEK